MVHRANSVRTLAPWNGTTEYEAGVIVSFEGSSYVSTVANEGEEPGVSSDWEVLSAKGEKGEQGEQGEKGETGETGEKGERGTPGKLGSYVGAWNARRNMKLA